MPRLYKLILVAIILLGAFLRLYNSFDGLRFFDDEVRDIVAIEGIWNGLVSFDWRSLPMNGPYAQIYLGEWGYAHHGAFYYYLMVFPALISGFQPYGLALFIILLNIISVYLMYFVGEKMFGVRYGLISALLLAISSFAVYYSRWAWNPNLVIFFSLLTLVSFLKIYRGNMRYWPLFGFAVAATTQIHILGYLFIAVVFLPLTIRYLKIPSRKILLVTCITFILPILPEIISLYSNGFNQIRVAFDYIINISSPASGMQFLDTRELIIFVFKSITNFLPPYISFFGISLVWVALLLFTICAFEFFRKISTYFKGNFKKMSGQEMRNLRFGVDFFGLWGLASILIIFISQRHLAMGTVHTLLFILPLFLMILAVVINQALSSRFFAVFGIILILTFVYINVAWIEKSVWKQLMPSYKDQLSAVTFLSNRIMQSEQEYELETSYYSHSNSIFWLLAHKKTKLPVRLNGDRISKDKRVSADVRYQVLSTAPSYFEPFNTPCAEGILEGQFGFLVVYRCSPTSLP